MELDAQELERRVEILRSQDFYKGPSYIDEQRSKPVEQRFEDLVQQIKDYGWPDFNYMVYGMDTKTPEESRAYVNAMEFVYRSNYLNFERNPLNSCCILRNKLYFGIYQSTDDPIWLEKAISELSEALEAEDIDLKIVKGFEILCDDEIFNIKYFIHCL